MKKQLFSVVTILCLLSSCREIKKNNDPLAERLTTAAAKKDLAVFKGVLDAAHPSLSLYISKKRLDQLTDSIGNTILENITKGELYNKLAFLANEIGCSHTEVDFPEVVYDSLDNRPFFFPYPVCWVENKLLVNATGCDLPEGTEITSINGEPVATVMQDLMQYNPVEGWHRQTQSKLAADFFGTEYYFKYGPQSFFKLQVKDTGGITKTHVADPVNLNELKSRISDQVYYYDSKDLDYNFYCNDEKNYAYLRLSTFDFGSNIEQSGFENFCANSFELLHYKKSIKTLIIDLRQNGGGRLYNAFLLYSYLAKNSFKEYENVISRINKVPYSQYLDPGFLRSSAGDVNTRLEEEFYTKGNADYYKVADSIIDRWDPDKYHFTGKVFVITDRRVMSSASYFATMVKNSGTGKIVGDEATGGSSSGNGYTSLEYILPNSGIKLYFPYAHLVYSFRDKKNTGFGLKPDYLVPDDIESFKRNSDRQIRFVTDSLILK